MPVSTSAERSCASTAAVAGRIGVITGYLGAAPTLLWALGAAALIFAPLLVLACRLWLYTLVFAFAALWFAHYALARSQQLRSATVHWPFHPSRALPQP